MARFAVAAIVNPSGSVDVYHTPDVVNATTTVADKATLDAAVTATVTTTVAANVATLVADAGSPTQGHVNTLNTNWGVLLTAINALKTAITAFEADVGGTPTQRDVVISFDATKTTSLGALKAATNALLRCVAGGVLS